MGSPHGEQLRFSANGSSVEVDNLPGSGRESPLSVSELPPSHGSNTHAVNAAAANDGKQVVAALGIGPEALSGPVHGSVAEWPRGRPRNAVSRVGYLNDAEETSAGRDDDNPVLQRSGRKKDLPAVPVPQAAVSSQLLSPGEDKTVRAMSRHRIQQMHLAIPTAM